MKRLITTLLFIPIFSHLCGQVSISSKTSYQHKDIFRYNEKTYMLSSPDLANARNRMYDLLKTFELYEIDDQAKTVEKHIIDIKSIAKDFVQYNFSYVRKGRYLIFEYNLLTYTSISQLCRVYCYDLDKKELKTINIEQKKKMENKIYSVDVAQNEDDILYVFVNRNKVTDGFTGSTSCDFDIIKYNLNSGNEETGSVSFNEKFSVNYISMMNEGQLFLSLYSVDTKNFWAIYNIESKEIIPISFQLKNRFYSTYFLIKIGEKWYFEIHTGTENKINETEIFEINPEDGSSRTIQNDEEEYKLVKNNGKNNVGNNENQFYDLVREDTKLIYTHFENQEAITKDIEIGAKVYLTSYYIQDNQLHLYSNNSDEVGGKIYKIIVDLNTGELLEKTLLKSKLKITKEPHTYITENGVIKSIFVSYDKKLKSIVFSFETNEF